MDGVINVCKPPKSTSYDVIRHIKRTFHLKEKIGHAGTLDPLAQGVLVILIGKATKLSSDFMYLEKEYIAKMLLGIRTDTCDIDGKVIEKQQVSVGTDQIKEVLSQFTGTLEQIPPDTSAIKFRGKRLYKLQRQGIPVNPRPRTIFVRELEILSIDIPHVEFRIVCSKGTYTRSICRDTGEKLGCGATQEDLTRTRIGFFDIQDSVTIKDIDKYGLEKMLIPFPEIMSRLSTAKSHKCNNGGI